MLILLTSGLASSKVKYKDFKKTSLQKIKVK